MRRIHVCNAIEAGFQSSGSVQQSMAARWLRWAIVFVALMIAAAVASPVHGVVQMRSTSNPVMVELNLNSVNMLMDATSSERQNSLQGLIDRVQAASAGNQLVVIQVRGLSLRFEELSAAQKETLVNKLPDERHARGQYERAIAMLLEEAIGRARLVNKDLRISVFGLPIEGDEDANRRYASVIEDLSAIVTGPSTETEKGASIPVNSVNGSFPAALEEAAGRPIYYRSNDSWMVAIGSNRQAPPDKVAKSSGAGGGGGGGKGSAKKTSKSKGGGGGGGGGGKRGGGGSAPVVRAASSGSPSLTGSTGSLGGTSGGGSTPTPAPPPPLPTPTGTPQLKLLVAEGTSPAVKATYGTYHAQTVLLLYQGSWDSDNNGVFEPELFQSQLQALVPEDYSAPVCLDWEGPAIIGLTQPIGSPAHTASLEQFTALITMAKQLRPHAKFGFYGLPIGRYLNFNDEWRAMAQALSPIWERSGALFPSVYDTYHTHEFPGHDPQSDLLVTREIVKLALQMSGGKPVYPFVWHRYDPNNITWGFKLIPDDEFIDNARAVFQTSYNGDRADGIVWWGADPYWRWLSLQNYSPSHPSYAISLRLRNIFNEEIPPGQSDAEHFDQLHTHILIMLSQVLDQMK